MSPASRYSCAFVACLAIFPAHLGVRANVMDATAPADPAPRIKAVSPGATKRHLVVSDLAPYDFIILPEDDRPYTAAELVRAHQM